MKKPQLKKEFNLEVLENEVKNENSCIFLNKVTDHLALHPYHLQDVTNSMNEILNSKLGKFCHNLDGILCGYKNIKLLSEKGGLCDDSPFIHVNIEADFYIFKPLPNKLLTGIVNKISKDHVGCLVHNLFNVSISKPKHAEDWLGKDLTLKSVVELKIIETNFEGKLPFIKGEIVCVLEKAENNEIEEKKSKKSKKKVEKESKDFGLKKSKKNKDFVEIKLETSEDIKPILASDEKPKKRKHSIKTEDTDEEVKPKKSKK